VDAAFLTTYRKLVYPFAADISAPRASYIRFRIDELPQEGVTIRTYITTHAFINSTPSVHLNPTGMDTVESHPHTRPGYTVWYCLQDIERAPPVGFGEIQLHIMLSTPTGKAVPLKGATQLSMHPYADRIVREFDWNGPDGRHINIVMEFERWRDYLKTFRDCARDYYEWALESAGGRLRPMTRPGLFLGGSGGGATPDMLDYVSKSLRLLGFNVAGGTCGDLDCRERFGWGTMTGAPRMEWYLPFTDEQDSLRKYEEYYTYIKTRPDYYEGCPVWQIADEPGEGLRYAISSPLWRYEEKEGAEPQWVDYPGDGGLFTRKTDYHDCVLEAKYARRGGNTRILVGVDRPEEPTRFAYWILGKVLPYRAAKENIAAGQEGLEALEGKREVKYDPNATIGGELTPIKIVYEGDKAALFVRGKLVHEHDRVPKEGGFGFDCGSKALAALRIRPIRANEHLGKPEAKTEADLDAGTEAPDTGDDELVANLEEVDEKDLPEWAKLKPLKEFVEQDWVITGGYPEAHEGFRQWAAAQGVTPDLFGKKDWKEVSPLTLDHLVETKYDRRLFYWSRQYTAYLTPKMFSLAAQTIRKYSPSPSVHCYIGLAGGYLNVYNCTVLDMFQLAAYDNGLMPGTSDWYWAAAEGQQVNAYSAAIFNAGARRYGQRPASISMMHIVHPSPLRSYATLANGVKYLSYYNFGPYVLGVGGDNWSHKPECYQACGPLDSQAAQVDDLLIPAVPRPSKVALLWSQATDHWNQRSSFLDKRRTFLALSHEYYQPDLLTEAQVLDGALEYYDALYVVEPYVVSRVQQHIADWVRKGGLLWACADSLTRNEYNEPEGLLEEFCGLERTFPEPEAAKKTEEKPPAMEPVDGGPKFRAHSVSITGMPKSVACDTATVRARYAGGGPAWLEWTRGKGKVVYIAHRAGETYGSRIARAYPRIWPDTGRSTLTRPLLEARIERDLILSEPLVMAVPLESAAGTVVVLHNMHPSPRRDLQISLREPAKPHSVEAFEKLTLKPLPFEHRDGRIHMTLPVLDGGQMIAVRRRPAPPDDRTEKERKRTESQLASAEPLGLAAGAWFAGFHPEWQMANKIVPLVHHERWEVRRSAAESLGRLGHATAGDEIAAALSREADNHAKGDQIMALAALKHPRAAGFCLQLLTGSNIFVKRQAIRAALLLLPEALTEDESADESQRAFASEAAELALQEPDARVTKHGISLLFRLDPVRGLDLAVEAAPGFHHYDARLMAWAKGLARNDAAFSAWLERGLPGGDEFLLAVATQRRDPKLASALVPHLQGIGRPEYRRWIEALKLQKDEALARALFGLREESKLISSFLPTILEHTFEARLGNDLGHWETWLAKRDGN